MLDPGSGCGDHSCCVVFDESDGVNINLMGPGEVGAVEGEAVVLAKVSVHHLDEAGDPARNNSLEAGGFEGGQEETVSDLASTSTLGFVIDGSGKSSEYLTDVSDQGGDQFVGRGPWEQAKHPEPPPNVHFYL